MSISVTSLSKTYGGTTEALHRVDLEVGAGELMVVVGPSGSGKTTLLRCIAGLDPIDSGSVVIDGRDVGDVPPAQRDIAMVFQDLALYPHLDLFENVAFGLRARRAPAAEVERKVAEVAAMLGISEVLRRRPHEVSGGERQRAAIARAAVREPAVFLLDEPLASLDPALRGRARRELRALHRRLGVAMIYVTHDQNEAASMADRITVLNAGRVEQTGTAEEVAARPASPFVAGFFGTPPMNVAPAPVFGRNGEQVAGIHPRALRIVAPAAGRIAGRVVLVEPNGPEVLLHVEVPGAVLVAAGPPGSGHPQEVGLDFDDADVHVFPGARP